MEYRLKCECGFHKTVDGDLDTAIYHARNHFVLGSGHAVTATKPLHNIPGRRQTIAFIGNVDKRPNVTIY
jgi:hypothetical protein